MKYTQYILSNINKNLKGKILYKKQDVDMLLGTILLLGNDGSIKSTVNAIAKQCLDLHKKWLMKLLKKYPELSELFSINDINHLKTAIDYKFASLNLSLPVYDSIQTDHEGYAITLGYNSDAPLPNCFIGLSYQQIFSITHDEMIDADDRISTVNFEICLDSYTLYELDEHLRNNGISTDLTSI